MISRVLRFLASPAGRALIALGLVLLLGLVFHADGAFYKFGTHRDAIRQASVCGILACGMTLVIITAGIDLAVGSILGLTGVCFALMTIHWGWPAWQAIPAALAAGAACGAVAGILTAGAKIQPFIATLAMMVFARGLAKWASEGKKISQAVTDPDGSIRFVDIPKIFEWIDSRLLGGTVSGVTIVFLVCVAVTWILLARHRWGRQLYAIGGNEEAARADSARQRSLVSPTKAGPAVVTKRGGHRATVSPSEQSKKRVERCPPGDFVSLPLRFLSSGCFRELHSSKENSTC